MKSIISISKMYLFNHRHRSTPTNVSFETDPDPKNGLDPGSTETVSRYSTTLPTTNRMHPRFLYFSFVARENRAAEDRSAPAARPAANIAFARSISPGKYYILTYNIGYGTMGQTVRIRTCLCSPFGYLFNFCVVFNSTIRGALL